MLGPRRVLVAWACGLLVAGAAPSIAEPWGRLESPAAGSKVHAGDVVEIRWGSLPDGLDEFELLLSVDGGKTFSIRLTPQLDPGLRSLRWQVPNLSAPQARLRLRVGIDGEEVEGPPGPEFSIAASPRVPISGLELRAGEWWVTDAPLSEPGLPVTPLRVLSPHADRDPVLVACAVSKPSARASSVSWPTTGGSSALRHAAVGRENDRRPCPETRLRP